MIYGMPFTYIDFCDLGKTSRGTISDLGTISRGSSEQFVWVECSGAPRADKA